MAETLPLLQLEAVAAALSLAATSVALCDTEAQCEARKVVEVQGEVLGELLLWSPSNPPPAEPVGGLLKVGVRVPSTPERVAGTLELALKLYLALPVALAE